jgi:hypothetical protein
VVLKFALFTGRLDQPAQPSAIAGQIDEAIGLR